MRAIPNLLEEVEVLTPDRNLAWSQVWGAEVLGRAIGHELRYVLVHWETVGPLGLLGYFADFIDQSLPRELVGHHIADVLL